MRSPLLPLSRHPLVHTSSLEEAREVYGRLDTPITMERTGRGEPFECRINAVAVGPLTVSSQWHHGGLRASSTATKDTFSLVFSIVGSTEIIHGDVPVQTAVGHTASIASPGQQEVKARLEADSASLSIIVRSQEMDTAFTALTGHTVRTPLRFEPHIDIASGGGAALPRLLNFLVAEIERDEQLLGAPRVATRVADALLYHLLSTQPHNHRALLEAPARAAEPHYVQRAAEYLEAQAGATVSMANLAAVTGVSIRSLQAGFRAYRDCSPMEFLRARRLELARKQLLAGTAATVAQVALDCGFEHLGRFSAYYRVRFGEPPATTWRRARTCGPPSRPAPRG